MSKNDETPAGGFEAGNGAAGPDNPALAGIKGRIQGLTRRQQHKLVWRHNRVLALAEFGQGPPTETPDPTLNAIGAQLNALPPTERDALLRGAAESAKR
jgi:hypothetical protein